MPILFIYSVVNILYLFKTPNIYLRWPSLQSLHFTFLDTNIKSLGTLFCYAPGFLQPCSTKMLGTFPGCLQSRYAGSTILAEMNQSAWKPTSKLQLMMSISDLEKMKEWST